MNWDRIDGDLKHFKDKTKGHRNKKNDEIDYSSGRRDYLFSKKQDMQDIGQDDADYQLLDRQNSQKGRELMSKPKK